MSNDPSKVSDAVTAMQEDWVIVDALMGGTKAMRKAGKALLEQMPDEDDRSYECRLKRSTLYPAYSETVGNDTGRVFAKPITTGEDVPGVIADYLDNIDRQGNNLQVWAQNVFSIGLAFGLCHVLADYPNTTPKEGEAPIRTALDEKVAGVRPYAVMIHPKQVIGWKAENVRGEQVLTQFRYMESVEVADPDNDFTTVTIPQVRVLEPGKWTTYRKSRNATTGKEEWAVHEEGLTSLSVIPLATLYTGRTGYMTASPPLMELAHLAVKHWNEQSDQDKSVRFARIRLAVMIGVDDDAMAKVKISSDSMLSLPKDADLKVVQGSAESVTVGRTELDALEEQMRVAGAKLLQKEKQVVKTAAQANEESAQEMSPLETMAGQLEDCLDQVLQFMALYIGLPDGGSLSVNGNFEVDYAPEVTLPFLLNMSNAGKLSDETLFSETQRRGVLSDELTWEDEKGRIDAQGPALGALNDSGALPADE